jgi:transcriptional regulator with XRE-family HTH domain
MNGFSACRTAARMKQKTVGEILGIAQNTISSWEIGVSKPRADLLPAIAKLYGCTVDALLADYEDEGETK